jgi:hypothetical protein
MRIILAVAMLASFVLGAAFAASATREPAQGLTRLVSIVTALEQDRR